jgi:methionyl-tRNA formyltransferase
VTAVSVVYVGSEASFSHAVLDGLLTADCLDIRAVVLNKKSEQSDEFRIKQNSAMAVRAKSLGLPMLSFDAHADSTFARQLRKISPQLIIVGCFGCRIPQWMTETASIAGMNVHPSLLPRYRGPDPLFWQFRQAEMETGVSIHCLSEELDAGDLFASNPVTLPRNCKIQDAEVLLASTATNWLSALNYKAGRLASWKQVPADASQQCWPSLNDYVVHTSWSATRAAGFISATASRVAFHRITGSGVNLVCRSVAEVNESDCLTELLTTRDGVTRVAFNPGYLDIVS